MALLLVFGSACDSLFPTTDPSANALPETQLADNTPVPGDTLNFSLVTMHWNGGDPDGYVTAYEYRIFTSYCDAGCLPLELREPTSRTWEGWEPTQFDDSTGWTRTDETSRTIAFSSRDRMNRQFFQVRAIDDLGATSEPDSASTRVFFTPNSAPPVTEIVEPVDGASHFALEETSDWFHGVELLYTARVNNPEKEILEYGWKIAGQPNWHWTRDTTVVIPPSEFMQAGALGGEHTIVVTARDNTNLLAHDGPGADSVTVTLVQPTFQRGLLIIDETNEAASGSEIRASDATVDSIYAAAFEPDGTWDYLADGMPPREVLGQYETVLWHADNYYASADDKHSLPEHTDIVKEYMEVGGDFIMSGFRILASFDEGGNLPGAPTGPGRPFEEDSFIRRFLHIRSARETPYTSLGDFVGAAGQGSFSDVSVSQEKLPGYFPFIGRDGETKGLVQVNIIAERASFTENIFSYVSPGASGYRGQSVGIQYYGTVFDAIVLGFPIYFLEDEDIMTLADEIMASLESDG